ncbi:uncharacterized protein CIMG_11408 [Coccidioides immitis RS]|uniref:Uncharacterized protein n=1 Tax=Coccidioides immitis (strain RS) TaxID=246410 RepID=A0A0D8JUL6_COCIM|nr:uncharacterized protein CIMG_11408 [Coccidioides immitis RS]KJF61045.1 hypothetical protein CIMG_11408 [Coccidioides immitis RS]
MSSGGTGCSTVPGVVKLNNISGTTRRAGISFWNCGLTLMAPQAACSMVAVNEETGASHCDVTSCMHTDYHIRQAGGFQPVGLPSPYSEKGEPAKQGDQGDPGHDTRLAPRGEFGAGRFHGISAHHSQTPEDKSPTDGESRSGRGDRLVITTIPGPTYVLSVTYGDCGPKFLFGGEGNKTKCQNVEPAPSRLLEEHRMSKAAGVGSPSAELYSLIYRNPGNRSRIVRATTTTALHLGCEQPPR